MHNIYSNVKTDRQYRATTGLSKKLFFKLSESYSKSKKVYYANQAIEQVLQAKHHGYNNILKSEEEELFFILFYLKTYPSLDVLGLSFGMDSSVAYKNIERLLAILLFLLEDQEVLPFRSLPNKEELEKRFGQLSDLLIDGTEREIQRPDNEEEQKKYYSGKKSDIA